MPDDVTRTAPPPDYAATATGPTLADGPDEPAPDRIGRFPVLGELARGGMGVVYRAHDPAFDREVAVKLLAARLVTRPEAVGRFLDEARVTGQLQHPGIPPVHDVGELPDGRPFLAMKLIKGQTLDDLLKERADPSAERGRFVAIFEHVCQAVGYAHSRGVIHRDLKPANVMVGAFGEVQVMDWGLAKLLTGDRSGPDRPRPASTVAATEIRTLRDSDGSQTEAGSVLGTPAYMPPEQAGGEISKVDQRADVFGLGAILCAILTGTPPYVGEDGDAVRLMAIRGELAEAFARLARCGAEPELVGLATRCLARDPADRPRDAGAVASAAAAHRAAAADRLRAAEVEGAAAKVRAVEEQRRRRLTVGLAVAVLATTVIGGGAAAWQARQWQAAAARADSALAAAEVLRDQAAADPDNPVGRWRDARLAVEKAGGALAEDAPPAVRERLTELAGAIDVGLAAAEGDRNLIEQLDKIRAEKEGADADKAFAAAFKGAGLDADALSAEEFAAKLSAKPPTVRTAALPVLDVWAMFRRDTGNTDGVKRLFAAARAADPHPWRNRLRTALEARDLKALQSLASDAEQISQQGPVALWLLALGHALRSDNKGAIKVLSPAVIKFPGDYALNTEIASALVQAKRGGAGTAHGILAPSDPVHARRALPYLTAAVALRPGIARAHLFLANNFSILDRHDEARAWYEEAIRLDPTSANLLFNYASALISAGEQDRAVTLLRKAVAIEPNTYGASALLASLLQQTGRAAEAEAIAAATTDAKVAAARREADAHPSESIYRVRYGSALLSTGRAADTAAAAEVHREIIRLHPAEEFGYTGLANALSKMGKTDEALDAARKAVGEARSPFAKGYSRTFLAKALRDAGRVDEALAEFGRVLADDPAQNASVFYHLDLAATYDKARTSSKAAAAYRRAIELDPTNPTALEGYAATGDPAAEAYYKKEVADDPEDSIHHVRLGKVWEKQGRADEAAESYRRALGLYPKSADARYALGALLRTQLKHREVVAHYREAVRVDPANANYHRYLGSALEGSGCHDEAVAAYRKALAVYPGYELAVRNLAALLDKRGDSDGAAAAYGVAAGYNPSVTAHNNHGHYLARAGKTEESIAAFDRALKLDPKSAYARTYRCRQLAASGRTAEALKDLATALATEPTSADFLVCRGVILQQKGDLDAAATDLNKAVSVAPKSAPAAVALASLLAERDDLEGAVQQYRRAVGLDPTNAGYRNNLGLYLARQGKFQEALTAYREALFLDPDGVYLPRNILRTERMIAVQDRLPAYRRGEFKPRTASELAGIGGLIHNLDGERAAAELFAAAFAEGFPMADDRPAASLYYAAAVAVGTAAATGRRAVGVTDADRARWRGQALTWLRSALAQRRRQFAEGSPAERADARDWVQMWLGTGYFTSVRDPGRLRELPSAERVGWEVFWVEVKAFRAETIAPETAPPPRPAG